MLGIVWFDRISNEDVWKQSDCFKGQLIKTIVKRQITFIGHIYRHRNIEHLVLTGRIPGLKISRETKKDVDG